MILSLLKSIAGAFNLLYLQRLVGAYLHAGRVSAAAVAFEHLPVRAEARYVKRAECVQLDRRHLHEPVGALYSDISGQYHQ